MKSRLRLRLGTRGSLLARWQTDFIRDQLLARFPRLEVEIKIYSTKGDRILDSPLSKIGGKGLFVRELEEAITRGEIDGAVHSMKDMPVDLPPGLSLVACLPREDSRDVFISRTGMPMMSLPAGSVIGTSSLRRRSQLLALRPDFSIVDLRGNLETRLRKVQETGLDGIIVAAAGIHRLGHQASITEYLEAPAFIPAVCQGIITIEANPERATTSEFLIALDDSNARIAADAERAFLSRLQGGCQVPVAANAVVKDSVLSMIGLISSLDGRQRFMKEMESTPAEAVQCGRLIAETCLAAGGQEILDDLLGRDEEIG